MTPANPFAFTEDAAASPEPAVKPEVNYYLQVNGEQHWEQVDEFVYNNWDKATTSTGERRYNGNGVAKGKAGVAIRTITPLTPDDVARIARFCHAGHNLINVNYTLAGGIVREPEFVPITLRKKTVLRDIKNGKSWKC